MSQPRPRGEVSTSQSVGRESWQSEGWWTVPVRGWTSPPGQRGSSCSHTREVFPKSEGAGVP